MMYKFKDIDYNYVYKFLKSGLMKKRYNLIISTLDKKTKRKFSIDWRDRDNVILYINKNVRDLSYFFYKNTKIKSIEFKNFDSSNILYLKSTFEILNLDRTLDLSNLDLSSLVDLTDAFSRSKINGDIVLPNNLKNIETLHHAFFATKANKIILDINAPKLKDFSFTFMYTNINELYLNLQNSKPETVRAAFSHIESEKPLILKNINFEKVKHL